MERLRYRDTDTHREESARDCQQPLETRRVAWKRFLPYNLRRESGPADNLDFQISSLQNVRKYISVVLRHLPVCSNLLEQS